MESGDFASSIRKGVPLFFVPDVRATVEWYRSAGFTVRNFYEDGDDMVFAELALGGAEFALSPGGVKPASRQVNFWFFTDRVRDLYQLFKDRPEMRFAEDLYTPFYGGLQFSIQDNNGLELVFWDPQGEKP